MLGRSLLLVVILSNIFFMEFIVKTNEDFMLSRTSSFIFLINLNLVISLISIFIIFYFNFQYMKESTNLDRENNINNTINSINENIIADSPIIKVDIIKKEVEVEVDNNSKRKKFKL